MPNHRMFKANISMTKYIIRLNFLESNLDT